MTTCPPPAGTEPVGMSENRLYRPHPYACRCAGCTARTALGLLATGRTAQAKALLEGLPDLISDELGMAYARGHDDVVVLMSNPPRPRQEGPRKPESVAVTDLPAAAEPEMPPQRRTRQKGRPRPGKPAFKRLASELRDHVARLGPHRVAELLGIQVSDLVTLMEGRADVSKDALKRVRAAEA